jgi:energy-coupling factor transporter ATP-binding protein EcfA2
VAGACGHLGRARTVGITGAPGVGKSTLVQALGLVLLGRGETVAVLATDPSSPFSGGALLGDRVRMPDLLARGGFVRSMATRGALDFAGGTVVHISSGISALVTAIYLGRRIVYGKEPILPHNLPFTVAGAALLWVGWFGFNAGSATSAGMQAGMAMSKSPQGLPLVNLAIIQQGDDVPAKMTQQMSEEFADLKSADIVRIKAVIQAQALNPGADRNSRNGRDFVPASEMTEKGRLSARRPGLQHVRNQEEPRFVEKDEMGAQPCGVFFTCGQRCRFQRSMASSFRSRARRSGF